MPRRAFVTGATGVLGLNLIEQLAQADWDVTALHRPTSNLVYLKRFPVRLALGSIEDSESLFRAMPQDIDVVFHLAADVSFWSQRDEAQRRTNVDGTRNVVEAALLKNAKRFIHTSSMGVYGVRPEPFDESAAKLGRNSWVNYFRTKAEGEEIVLAAVERGLKAVILNPSNIVGRYDRHNWGRMFLLGQRGKLIGAPRGRASYCHAAEVAKAHIAAVDLGRVGQNYLLGGTDATYLKTFQLVAALVNEHRIRRVRQPIPIPRAIFRLYGRVCEWISLWTKKLPDLTPEIALMFCGDQVIRSDLAERDLGYRAIPFRSMFEDCFNWLVEEGIFHSADLLRQKASAFISRSEMST